MSPGQYPPWKGQMFKGIKDMDGASMLWTMKRMRRRIGATSENWRAQEGLLEALVCQGLLINGPDHTVRTTRLWVTRLGLPFSFLPR